MRSKINKNSVSLAGEFAVLSQLALRGYDANMTLGNTKGVDILVSDSNADKLYKLEVKTSHQSTRNRSSFSKVHGRVASGWIMNKKHEDFISPNLFYCFVNIGKDSNEFKFYIIPSKIVAQYVRDQHSLWLNEKKKEGKKVVDSDIRIFRIGLKSEKYAIKTPLEDKYENNWSFRK